MENPKKIPKTRTKNKLNSQTAPDRNRSRGTLVRDECFNHCAIPASLKGNRVAQVIEYFLQILDFFVRHNM